MGECGSCPLYLAAREFCEATGRRPSPTKSDYTVPGKLIAAGARAKGLTVREVSIRIGRAGDYLTRVCRGKLALHAATAYAVGRELGIDLGKYVGYEGADQMGMGSDHEPGLPGIGP